MKGIDLVSVPVHPDMPEEVREIEVGEISISGKDFNEYKGGEVRLLHLFNVDIGNKTHVTSIGNKKIPRINWVSKGVKSRVLLVDGSWVEGLVEPSAAKINVGTVVQFERFGFVRYDGMREDIAEYWFAHN
ncbi:hypothetical protein J4416_02670 [Candidatus Pacearchaeota archaeon]|nr:hypothetical protein [Candidatus Pacearchaeota archaeon]